MGLEEILIRSIMQGYSLSCAVYAACKLNIFDYLYCKELSRNEISVKISGDIAETNLLLNLLIVNGLVEEKEQVLKNTNIGDILTEKSENSLKSLVLFTGSECIPAWLNISEAITGKSFPYKIAKGSDFFSDNYKNSANFMGMMGNVSERIDLNNYLVRYDKNISIKVIDIGGGTGEIVCKFLNYFENATGEIFDLKHVEKKAIERLNREKVSERCSFKASNFFEKLDFKANLIILSRVLHDWGTKDALKILENISNNMDYDTKVIVIENVMPNNVEKKDALLHANALHIWSLCGGQERTEDEFKDLFFNAGMQITNQFILKDSLTLLEVTLIKEEGSL